MIWRSPFRSTRLAVHATSILLFVAWASTVRAQPSEDAYAADPYATSLIIVNGFLVFFMQVGFLAYETGSGRAKNVRNILLKNLLDVMLAAIVWWAVGYAFAYGKSGKGVIGTNLFFYEGGSTYDKQNRPWFFSWTFCIAACTIISGCLAERTALAAYPVATLLISGVVHPLLVHWLWSPSGWMSHLGECQVLDFAGGMVVHMLGGLFGLVGAWKCGPRLGRFELVDSDEECEEEGPHTSGSVLELDAEATAATAAAASTSQVVWDASAAAAAAIAAVRPGSAPRPGAPGSGLMQRQQQLAHGVLGPLAAAHGSTGNHSCDPPPAIVAKWALDDPASIDSGGSFPGWPGGARLAAAAAAGDSVDVAARRCGDSPAAFAAIPPAKAAAAGARPAAGAAHASGSMSIDAKPANSHDTVAAAAGAAAGAARFPSSGMAGAIRHKLASVSQKVLRVVAASSTTACSDGGSTARTLRGVRQRRQPVRCGVCRHTAKPMPGHDMAFVTLGTFMLWFGWFGFNNGSVYMYVAGNAGPSAAARVASVVSGQVVQRTSMNTALGGASGGLTALLMAALFSGTYDLRICCNGVLSGLVTVTCMCGFVDPWAAVVCSGIAGALYTGMSHLLLRCGVDDPLDSSAVHMGNGLIGTIMLAFVAKPEHVLALTGSPCGGVFYSSSGWMQLALQLLGVSVVVVFAGGAAWIMFELLDRYGLLRVDQVTELAGIDNMDHGGPAYPEFTANSFNAPVSGQNAASAGRRMLQ